MNPAGDQWRAEAQRLLAATQRARDANCLALWRDVIAVEAYRGRETQIASLVDHACKRTIGYLQRGLSDVYELEARTYKSEFADISGQISFDKIMVATFFSSGWTSLIVS